MRFGNRKARMEPMTKVLEEAFLKIEEQKRKLQNKEKLLNEKEKKIENKKLFKVGILAKEAGIHHWNELELLGAFLTLEEKIDDRESLQEWKIRAEEFRKKKERRDESPLMVCFKEDPKKSSIEALKSKKFRWNGFRKEWYGYGNRSEVEALLCNERVSIEVAH